MPRLLVAAFAIALLAFSAPAAAGRTLPPDLEVLTAQLEALIVELLGHADVEPVFEAHGDGLYSLSVPLSPGDRERLLARSASVKPLTTLRNGNQTSTPRSSTSLTSVVFCSIDTDYNFWFVALNLSDEDLRRKTTNTVRGPGLSYKRVDNLIYPALMVQTYWFELEDAFPGFGIFTHKTKIATGGAVKGKLFAH